MAEQVNKFKATETQQTLLLCFICLLISFILESMTLIIFYIVSILFFMLIHAAESKIKSSKIRDNAIILYDNVDNDTKKHKKGIIKV
jgi:hypothetical protein